ncbi:hypothetical protein QNM97_12540 [Gordonia sp. L191]|uniref:hypothetical protein n=1 Tax=Gordonia sp. L191 TaxID=2982699 RepID=UPI0024BF1AED|nr:hypothetical protein [Gordonia sp. L191]WHU49736.1 hypothetical protein QNM97_12540 [Gordonia sp. L191]
MGPARRRIGAVRPATPARGVHGGLAPSTSVEQVFTCAVFVPSAPLLVPELAGPDADDTRPVREATRSAVTALVDSATRWVAVGADDTATAPEAAGPDATVRTDRPRCRTDVAATGTFARFGVDVPVTLDPAADTTAEAPSADTGADRTRLPLSMLIAAWLREQAGADRVTPVVLDPSASPEQCAAVGEEIAAALSTVSEPVGLLVVGDGAIALSPKAPGGGERESAVRLQQRIDAALESADLSALAGLDVEECHAEGVGGRVAWQVAAAVARAAGTHTGVTPAELHPPGLDAVGLDAVGLDAVGLDAVGLDAAGLDAAGLRAECLYAAAPFGVGYVVARWTPNRNRS